MPKKSELVLSIEFNEIHKNKYSYVFTNYTNNKSKIEIVCPIHGSYYMSISQHQKGYGCGLCAGYKKSKNDILVECSKTHNSKYNYTKTTWIKLDDDVVIICPEHGEFNQSLKTHRSGYGCTKCSNRYNRTNQEFIDLCKSMNSDINTTITNFINVNTQVSFICKNHGLISYLPMQIIKRGYVCHKCKKEANSCTKFIEESIIIHNDRFDYSMINYVDSNTKIKIIDKQTGFIFEQTPNKHKKHDYFYNKSSLVEFITKSNIIHNNKYDYTKSIYIGNKNKVTIECPSHGEFKQIPNNHLAGSGCPKCNRFNIKESELYKFISDNCIDDIKTSDRSVLDGKEIDVLIPSLKLGFEFNGLYWHSELYKEKSYHYNKSKSCDDKGVQLIHIWEDDWDNKKDICKSIILNKLNKSKKIFARKTVIKEINNDIARKFLEKNHIQGFVGSRIKIGLYYDDILVSIMTFGGLRKSLGHTNKTGSYELLRFCNILNTSVVGGASKMFKYFIKKYNPHNIISYADSSRSIGGLYKKLGFSYKHQSVPNYYYIINGERKHRYNYRKDSLVKSGYDINKTEIQIMNERGYYRIFDCGSTKWEYIIT